MIYFLHQYIISRTTGDMPCLNCRLIEMGEMACYQERCPQCDKVPPCKKLLLDELQGSRGLGKVYVNPSHGGAHSQRQGARGDGGSRRHSYREDISV